MNLAAFRASFPEFRTTSDTLIEATLLRAARKINAEVWGTKADDGQGLLTAHLLSLAPNGQQARSTEKSNATTYWKEYVDLRAAVTAFRRVF